jgi:hypothetical protein
MLIRYLADMARRIEQFAPLAAAEARGENDLQNMEMYFGVRLPAAVRAFPTLGGGRTYRRLPGLTTDCARLRLYRETAECLLRDSRADHRLASSDVVFWAPQDYQFFFFSCENGDDPPVFRFVEGELRPREVAPSFTEWIERLQ